MTPNQFAGAFVAGAGAATALVLIILATGQTFSQRCARAFPSDHVAQERCVFDLSSGKRI